MSLLFWKVGLLFPVGLTNGTPRPFVPYGWRRRIFNAVHGLGHPGVHRTRQMVSQKFVWPAVNSDAARWARECIDCQRSKVTRHVVPPIGEFEVPSRRFAHLNVDLVSLPVSNGYNHLLTVVDRFTRWPVAIPLQDISAETVADAFVHGWVSTYGVPQAVTTDRGSQFTSSIWTQLLKAWGIKPLLTTAYHPEANGLVERLHRRLKEALMALCRGSPELWYWKLPSALLSIRTTLKPDIGSSPADLVFGEGLALPADLLPTLEPDEGQLQRQRSATLANLRLEVARLQPTPTSAHRQPLIFIPPELDSASHVFVQRGSVRPSLSSPYEGPYRVTARTAAGFRVNLPGGRSEVIALSRLKPAHQAVDDGVESEPQDLDELRPSSPRPPGRPPGPRTRRPAPSTRVTRQAARSQRAAAETSPACGVPAPQPRSSTAPSALQPNILSPSDAPARRQTVHRAGQSASSSSNPSSSPPPPVAPPAPVDEDVEPSRGMNFFADMSDSAPDVMPPSAPPPPTSSRSDPSASAPAYATSSASTSVPYYFSDRRQRLGGTVRHFFSDKRPNSSHLTPFQVSEFIGICTPKSTRHTPRLIPFSLFSFRGWQSPKLPANASGPPNTPSICP